MTELNLKGFLRVVGGMVDRFDTETFFYLAYSTGTMKYLPEDPYTLTFASVLAEHESRITAPSVVIDALENETPESIVTQFKCYDEYEYCDWSLSRLTIEALVHPGLRADVVVQFNHTASFKKLPGSVYIMMVLDMCHEPFSYKVDEAAVNLEALELSEFSGENISKFANEVQQLIKIMKDG